jgi:hypothetical protein
VNRSKFLKKIASTYGYNFSSDLLKRCSNWDSLEGTFAIALIDSSDKVVAVTTSPILTVLEIRRFEILPGEHKIKAVVLGNEKGKIGAIEHHARIVEHPNSPIYLDFRDAKIN